MLPIPLPAKEKETADSTDMTTPLAAPADAMMPAGNGHTPDGSSLSITGNPLAPLAGVIQR